MRTTFLVGTTTRKSTRYLLVGRSQKAPFPGPWRLQAVIRNNEASGGQLPAATRDASTSASRVRSAAPPSTASVAWRTASAKVSARPAT